ncbi:MAG: primosomal protein N' [Sphingobacteriaceae bacterium]
MVTLFVDVIVPLSVPNKFTYRVPTLLNEEVEVGKRVLVQFGKSKIYTGIVYHIHETAPVGYQAKYIESVLDDAPVVTKQQLEFWDWMAFYYCANPGDVMNAALPSGLKLSSSSHVQINPNFNFEEIDHDFFTDTEHKVIEILHVNPNVSMDELADFLKLKSVQSLVSKLIKKNAVEVYEEVKDKYKPKIVSFIRLNEQYKNEHALKELFDVLDKKAFKQSEALLAFIQVSKKEQDENAWIKKSDLTKLVEASAVNALIKKEILLENDFEVDRLIFGKGSNEVKQLNDQQQHAFEQINENFANKKTVFLQGVTGSGKTEVYIKLIQQMVYEGKQVLYLVPEIALTTQLIKRLRAVFGELVGVYHSRFSENERVEIWNNILKGNNASQAYKIILAARSGLFLPFTNLGLIVIDEEHDYSFKQHSPAPRYHARDSAIYLAGMCGANVLLGSATPTLETYYNAQHDKFALVELKDPFVNTGNTDIHICDVKEFEKKQNMKGILTPPMFDAITQALSKKQQIILFQNRRGFAPYTQCHTCATVPYCKNCDVPLIYHKYANKLICHYCGYNTDVPKSCEACGSNDLRFKGAGTEKIEEDIELLFPDAKIARMDLDTTRSKYAHKQLIDDFESGAIDILIGTQMVTKGLDFENVSIVGIIQVDSVLNFPDFRSFERAFQLITQLKGRAGRKKHKGTIYIQTSQPQHPVLLDLLKNDQQHFYTDQLQEREQFNYPPFYRLIELNVISRDKDELDALANELVALLRPHLHHMILGPEYPLIPRIKNNYYKRVLLKLDKKTPAKWIREIMQHVIQHMQSEHKKWKFTIQVNVDPF